MNLLDLFFPRRCPVCDRALLWDEEICAPCARKLKIVRPPFCVRCGKSLIDERQEYCGDCQKKRHNYRMGRALFEYNCIRRSIYRFKYQHRPEYARFYAKAIVAVLGETIARWEPDALAPVPLYWKKRLARGYNQAELLAREIGKLTGIPVADKLVIRSRKTVPQKELNPGERQNNVKNAFKISRNDVKLDTIIIIDDIYTTGSTIDAVAAALSEAGIRNIYFIALAIGRG